MQVSGVGSQAIDVADTSALNDGGFFVEEAGVDGG